MAYPLSELEIELPGAQTSRGDIDNPLPSFCKSGVSTK